MLSTKNAQTAIKILIPLLVAVISAFILANAVPNLKVMRQSVESLDDTRQTVIDFTGATIATSLSISALPDDFATPLAQALADLNKYSVVILAAVFVERLLVVKGVRIAFMIMIPIACVLYAAAMLKQKKRLRLFANKIVILALAVILVVPFSTHFTKVVAADYMEYVDETIAEANDGADKINDVMTESSENATLFDKLSQAFKTAISGVSDLLDHFKGTLKKCVNSVAILIVTTFVIPFLTLLFFKWLLTELFKLNPQNLDLKLLTTNPDTGELVEVPVEEVQ